jgi:hypothetical protein
MKPNKVTFAQLRQFLEGFGFEFFRLRDRLLFEHKDSDTLFVFRRYRANEAVGEADLISVRHQLHYRGFMERDDFDEAVRTGKLQAPSSKIQTKPKARKPKSKTT